MRRARRYVLLTAFIVLPVMLILAGAGFRIAAALRETETADVRAPTSGRFVDTGHGLMFVQETGPTSRTPIVLIHGTAAWSEFWRGTIQHLEKRGHRVIAIDLPPFGFSERSFRGAYTRDDQARRIIGLLNSLGIDKAVFVGHSFGAGATVEAVMKHPERVAGLVLVSAALGLPDDGQAPAMPSSGLTAFLEAPVLPEVAVAATLTNPLLTRQLLGTMVARKEAATPELAAILRRPMTRVNTTPDFVRWARGFVSPDVGARSMSPGNYARISIPTNIIWGDLDSLTPLPQGERLARMIPGAQWTVLRSVGHIPQIEDPEAFRHALDTALARSVVSKAPN